MQAMENGVLDPEFSELRKWKGALDKKIVLGYKTDYEENMVKYKSCFMVRGFKHQLGDFDETYSPYYTLPMLVTIRLLLTFSAIHSWLMYQ